MKGAHLLLQKCRCNDSVISIRIPRWDTFTTLTCHIGKQPGNGTLYGVQCLVKQKGAIFCRSYNYGRGLKRVFVFRQHCDLITSTSVSCVCNGLPIQCPTVGRMDPWSLYSS
jgi:hypothetical protein